MPSEASAATPTAQTASGRRPIPGGPASTQSSLVTAANSAQTQGPLPRRPTATVSHETMYNAIYVHPRGELKRELIACLRHHNQVRKPRSLGADRRGQIPDMQSIHIRPAEVEDRLIPGHWEGDLIKGPATARRSARWSHARPALRCSPKWTTPPPRLSLTASPPC